MLASVSELLDRAMEVGAKAAKGNFECGLAADEHVFQRMAGGIEYGSSFEVGCKQSSASFPYFMCDLSEAGHAFLAF